MTTPTSPREILIAARKIIEEPSAWVRGMSFGRREEDGRVSPRWKLSDDMNCACAVGALTIATKGDYPAAADALFALSDSIGGYGVAAFNDHPSTTHADVLSAFDRAIASLEVTP